MMRAPRPPFPPLQRSLFGSEAEFLAERNRQARTKAEWAEQDKIDAVFHIVLATVTLVGLAAFLCFAAFALGGIEGLAWLFGIPLALFAFGFEVWRRL